MISKVSIILFVVSLEFIYSQALKAEYAKNELPYSVYSSSPVYDGEDSIYLMGGLREVDSGGNTRRILRFNLTSETVEDAGELFFGGFQGQNGAHIDSNGSLFYVGGGLHVEIFDPSVDSISKPVKLLPYDIQYSSKILLDDDKILILGGGHFSEHRRKLMVFDLKTFEATVLNETLPIAMNYSQGARLGNKAFIFGNPETSTNSPAYLINLDTLEVQLPPPSFVFPRMHFEPCVICDGKNFYLLSGNEIEANKRIPTNGIVQFGTDDFSWNFLEVENYLVQDFEFFYRPPASIYVDKFNRIYSFGGTTANFSNPQNSVDRKEIWYIDLSPPTSTEASSTTEATSTTLRPDLFSCSNKTDGFYPHPEDCAKFIGCHGGISEVSDCPVPLLFDPVDKICDYAENVECGLTCVGRPDGQYSHPHDCGLFLSCHSEEMEVFRCSPPLIFNPETLRCEYPESVQCNSNNN